MFEAKAMMYLYVETPLHAGTGRGLGSVDLPIQRERTTGYPILQASGIKGSMRAEAQKRMSREMDKFVTIFGPDTKGAAEHAGALSLGDGRLLLFPVQSLSGTFAWTTSLETLALFRRSAAMMDISVDWQIPDNEPEGQEAWVNSKKLMVGNSVVLEESDFNATETEFAHCVGKWIAENALPAGAEYDFWKNQIQKKLCILPENSFRDFALYSTEIQTHIKLDPDTKTVENGALWISESLPSDSLLYVPMMATRSRNSNINMAASEILQSLRSLEINRIQMGGDETTGQGIVSVTYGGLG